jgi:hypothetical protein
MVIGMSHIKKMTKKPLFKLMLGLSNIKGEKYATPRKGIKIAE